MELNGHTGFEYSTDGTTKTFKFGLSDRLDESVAGFIDRVNPQVVVTVALGIAGVCLGVDPRMRKQLKNAYSRWLATTA